MDRTERFYRIDQLLRNQRSVSLRQLIDNLEVSRATIRRDLEYLRDRIGAPIVWDRNLRGYRYDTNSDEAPRQPLPGLWFSAAEVHALLTMDHLLANLQPGLLTPHIAPLRERVAQLLEHGDHAVNEVRQRIRVLHMAARAVDSRIFESLSHALLRRRRLRIQHLNRRTAERTRRVVSPQRLAHYRDNWYLDSWCHLRKDLRSFAVDAIEAAELLPDDHAKDVSETKLDRVLGTGYGIFSGEHARNAVLRFSPSAARWVSQEQWHSRQEGCFDEAGYYQLTVPYTNATELVMDILRHGPNVEVLQPRSLRQHVEDQLAETTRLYSHAPSRQLP